MIRRSSNEKAAFTETTVAYNKELQAALSNRRAEMDDAWDTLDVEWKKLEKVMAFIGITKPVSLDGGVVHLNVGGEHLNVCRAVLESIYDKNSQQRWTLANLFDGVWDSRVPRDKGGRIFLDESPVIIKYLVHTQLKASTTNQASGESQDLTTSPHLPSDQRPYLQYVSNALELHDPSPGMQIIEAAAGALETMYGPDIATGKPDPVVELDVRGTRMTTLRSTLQACSESALAARFDDSKWPSDGKDFGVIDCSPLIFSKVLDVLRMRKRARWSNRDAQKQEANMMVFRVMMASGNRAPFEEFVGMYFPGCEAYVMDWVTFEGS
ncbi:unnamed protein product [Ascophyllum nodosum]